MKFARVYIIIVFLVLAGRFNSAKAGTLTPLWQFTGGADGGVPEAGLIQGSGGDFYGTTFNGGTNNFGVVFKITPTGTLTNLYRFTGHADGGGPEAPVIPGIDGNFYGTTFTGGTNGYGVVYKITSAGTVTPLWQFSNGVDGGEPIGGLVQGSDSNFYGTTFSGGTNNAGTVFTITPAGTLTTLWQFSGGADGGQPAAGLIQAADGDFHGTTFLGGTNGGNGTVFKITSAGTLTTIYRFNGTFDGAEPLAGLIQGQGSDTNFYGTTFGGGTSGNGAVFKLTSAGTLTPLYSFTGGVDGSAPEAELILGSDGLFYGTTAGGGTSGNGAIFRISSMGTFTNLYSFTGGNDGSQPLARLVQGSDSNFYGTTSGGGTNNNGVVFKFSTSTSTNTSTNTLTQITLIQIVGTNVVITIPSVIGQNYQLQYSDSLTPTVWINVAGASQSGTGGLITLTDVGGALQPHRFYRVDISSTSAPVTVGITSIQIVGADVVVTVPSVSGQTYQLQYTDSLTPINWVNTGASQPGTGSPITLTDVGGALVVPGRSYRVVISS